MDVCDSLVYEARQDVDLVTTAGDAVMSVDDAVTQFSLALER